MSAMITRRRRALIPLLAFALSLMVGLWLLPMPSRADNNGDDMVVFGGYQEVKEGQEVKGDLVVLGGAADVYGKVDGDAVAIGGKITIHPQGEVDGSLTSLGGAIDNQSTVTPHAHMHGGYHGMPTPPTPPENPIPMPQPGGRGFIFPFPGWSIFDSAWSNFVLLDAILVLVAFLLFPLRTRDALNHLVANPIMAGVAGFMSPIIFSLVLVALAITVIGIPLIPLVVVVAFLGYLIGKAAIAVLLGERIFDVAKVAAPKPIVSMLIGLLILTVLSSIGWAGALVYFCIMAFGVGAALYMISMNVQARRRMPPAATPPPPTPTYAPPVGPAPTGPPAVP